MDSQLFVGLDKMTDTTLYRWQDVVVVAWMGISDFAFDFYFQCSFPSPVFLFLPAVLFFFLMGSGLRSSFSEQGGSSFC